MGSRSAPWKADHCLIRKLPYQRMCDKQYETGNKEEERKGAKMANGQQSLFSGVGAQLTRSLIFRQLY